MTRRLAALASALMAASLLAACGESDKQVVSYKKGQYQGKPDARPWDNAPNEWSGTKWEKGNKASWEDAMKTRALAQNEYLRTD